MILANIKDCTACMACVDICSHQALSATIDANGYYKVLTNKNACVSCGLCSKICPILNPLNTIQDSSQPFAVWNNDSIFRAKSASGGAFSAVALTILERGGVVYGAAISGFKIIHRRITSTGELIDLLGSKYQQSETVGVYRQVRQDLKDGKIVLFSGMACQIAGLISFLRNTDCRKLYTIDTICGGVSTMLPILSLEESGKYVSIYSFRDKKIVGGWRSRGFKYALQMQNREGSIENLGLDNMVLNTFSSKLLKRSSCLDCHFTGQNHFSDCTIGDFWGDSNFVDQHSKGVSLMILHNDRFAHLIETAPLSMHRVDFEDFIPYNHNYIWSNQSFIRYFISRKIALWAMKKKYWKIAKYLMSPKSISGIIMSLYLKINDLSYRKAYRNFLQSNSSQR